MASDALYRRRQLVQSQHGCMIQIDGRSLLNVSSNDYLGLSQHRKVIASMVHAATQWGVGSSASPLVTGYQSPHQQCEQAVAEWCGFERGILFSSGYAANVGVCQTLLDADDQVMVDRSCHASIMDGLRLVKAHMHRYRSDRLHAHQQHDVKAWLSDSVFSMSGALAPLDHLNALAKKNNAWLVVDDAHGVGVCGPQGRGSFAHFKLKPHAKHVLVCPLGKAIGGAGAVVCGSHDFIEQCIQKARSYMYSTAMPAPVAAANAMAVRVMLDEPEHHARLIDQKKQFEAAIESLPIHKSHSAIYQWVLGAPERALEASRRCRALGVYCVPMRPPTVPPGKSGLRIVLSASMTEEDIEKLASVLLCVYQEVCDEV